MQRVTPDIRDSFGPLEEALEETFLPDLFQGLGEGSLGRGFTYLQVKQAGLDLLDPTKPAPENWTASCVITSRLVAALRVQEETTDHSACLQEGHTLV